MTNELYSSHLIWGPPGSGKTWFIVDAFFDLEKRQEKCLGRLISFGREKNQRLLRALPSESVVSFEYNALDPAEFVSKFGDYTRKLYAACKKGQGPKVIGFDGYSELAALFNTTKDEAEGKKLQHYGKLKDTFISAFELLDPMLLKADIIATARVGETREGMTKRDGSVLVKGDPEWMDYAYLPDAEGWARKNMGYYHEFILYLNTGKVMVEGKASTARKLHVVQRSAPEYLIKNAWEDLWLRDSNPNVMVNPTFEQFKGMVSKLDSKYNGSTHPAAQ